jgi:hypothetical protein
MRRALALLVLAASSLPAADWYLFSSFRENGQTGVFLALSSDGRTWTPLNGNRPWLPPDYPGELMRDPWIGQGPDGVWHMVWTWGWTRQETGGKLIVGHASSTDLVHWSPQQEIPVLENEPLARNAWAPEAVWDPARNQWLIFWSTTIPGRFPESDATGDGGYNHRLYSTTTRDWKTFTPSRLLFDPGFNCIDATMVHDGARWVMVFKDERKSPLQKKLRLAFADSPSGPWSGATDPFTRDWVEGPTVARVGNEWWIYFDHYTQPQGVGAVRTTDWKTFQDISNLLTFPADHRHGTVVRIPEALAQNLRSAPRPK